MCLLAKASIEPEMLLWHLHNTPQNYIYSVCEAMWLRRLENLAESPGPVFHHWNLGEEPGDIRCGAMLLMVLTAKGCLGNTVSVDERVGAIPAAGRPSQGNRD